MIPPPPPEMSMAMLRAEFRRVLDQPATPPLAQVIQQSAQQVDLKA
ncbi:MAG TPA: hypothetical protein VMW62_12145 [Chloroflexota bacterium]|nr:hypothetical protein [Chloroflexota bacterium]